MKNELYLPECVICGKIEFKGYWYFPFNAPPHEPNYQGALCPECLKKKQEKKKILETPLNT